MTSRSLGQIWQYGLGSVWAVIGALAVITFSVLHYLLPAPPINSLRSVSGVLVNNVEVHRPGRGGLWASFSMRTDGGSINARINNFGFIWNCDDTPEILNLKSGAVIAVWFSATELDGQPQPVAWRIEHEGRDLLSFGQSVTAHKAQEKRYFQFSIGMLVIGAALALWGKHIYRKEQR